jgi:hypothetical protein
MLLIDSPEFRRKYGNLYPGAHSQPCRERGCKRPVSRFAEDAIDGPPVVFYCNHHAMLLAMHIPIEDE